jgi:hypothetical protein
MTRSSNIKIITGNEPAPGRPTGIHDNEGKEPSGPIGWALYLWVDYQDRNRNQPPHKLWPKFLATIRNDPEVYEAAIQNIERPIAPKLSPAKERVFCARLEAAAAQFGIPAKERRVRELISADKFRQAAELRNQVLMDMRRLVGRITQELAAVSS